LPHKSRRRRLPRRNSRRRSPEPPGDAAREGLAPEIWVIGLIAVIVILLVLFGVAL
jgi:hypothetical protein